MAKAPKSEFTSAINRSKVGAKFKRDSVSAVAALEKIPPADIAAWLSGDEKEMLLEGKFAIERDMISVEETAAGFAIAPFEGGKVYLKTEMKKELYDEAMVREVARRVQLMRKERKLVEADKILLHVETQDKELLAILKRHTSVLAGQVNAELVGFSVPSGGVSKEWEIADAAVKITIEKK